MKMDPQGSTFRILWTEMTLPKFWELNHSGTHLLNKSCMEWRTNRLKKPSHIWVTIQFCRISVFAKTMNLHVFLNFPFPGFVLHYFKRLLGTQAGRNPFTTAITEVYLMSIFPHRNRGDEFQSQTLVNILRQRPGFGWETLTGAQWDADAVLA